MFYLLHAEDLHSIYTGHEVLCTIHNPIRVHINQLGTVIIPIDRDSRGSAGVFKDTRVGCRPAVMTRIGPPVEDEGEDNKGEEGGPGPP